MEETMKKFQMSSVFGLLMIAAGILFLFQSLGYLEGAGGLFWALVFAAAGGIFLYVFFTNREQWWALIPGFTLIGLGGLIALETLAPRWSDPLGVVVFMSFIGLSFWGIYLNQRENWWAIIPGGVLVTIAAFLAVEAFIPGEGVVGIFFIGLGLTFVLVAYLPKPEGQMQWALIPAGILLFMGVIFLATAVSAWKFIGPGILVLIGVYLIVRVLTTQKSI
jgi:hypothetical protein